MMPNRHSFPVAKSPEASSISSASRPKVLGVGAALVCAAFTLTGSDHADVPQVNGMPRQDANLTDLHVFGVNSKLVIALSCNPAIPRSAASYLFPNDVTFEINIDTDAPVSALDPDGMGGTILDPGSIQEDIVFRIRFGDDGQPEMKTLVHGRHAARFPVVNFYAGLRDDPFIRGPRIGRNVASVVLEVPLAEAVTGPSTLLVWATSKVEEADGPVQDLADRALRSMMPENGTMNTMDPRLQYRQMGVPPDVMIYDTARPAAYPDGRALIDDVVDLVGDPGVLASDAPFPSANDVPFLSEFPYLAPPHAPQ